MKLAELTCLLCALSALSCAFVLIKGYRRDHTRLLLWSSLCFALLAINNTFLFIDMVMIPSLDLWGSLWRALLGALSGIILLYGLTWELT